MLLNFYRYSYTQVRLAQELGLGTPANPNGLPYANDGLVVTVMESLTSNGLDVTMETSPVWTLFRDEDSKQPTADQLRARPFQNRCGVHT